MAKPSTREGFKDYCLRQLGAPVLEINVDDDQIDDLVDDALQFWQERHFDGTESQYLKYKITQDDIDRGKARVGNQGAEDGRIEGTGLVTGDFGSAFINGGSLETPPTLNEDPETEGVVRIEFYVRGDGKVIPPLSYISFNSTITDTRHIDLAKKAALTATFSTSNLPKRKAYIDFRFELE